MSGEVGDFGAGSQGSAGFAQLGGNFLGLDPVLGVFGLGDAFPFGRRVPLGVEVVLLFGDVEFEAELFGVAAA